LKRDEVRHRALQVKDEIAYARQSRVARNRGLRTGFVLLRDGNAGREKQGHSHTVTAELFCERHESGEFISESPDARMN
jgi:hypothetical protein